MSLIHHFSLAGTASGLSGPERVLTAQLVIVYSNQSGHEWRAALTAVGKLREEACLCEQGKDSLDLTRHAEYEVMKSLSLGGKARMGSI